MSPSAVSEQARGRTRPAGAGGRAMRQRSADGFAAYTSAGGLLPAATVRRVVSDPASIPSGGAEGYRLPPRSHVPDHIDRAWHDALAYYTDFTFAARAAGLLDDNDDPVGDAPGDPTLRRLSGERFVLPLLRLLGWDDLEERPAGIQGDADRTDAEGDRMRWDVSYEAVKRNVPVHVVGFDVPVDERNRGAPGANRQSPHSTVQDLLNGSDRHLWGIVVNGRRLRMLRDSSSLTRQAYAEFDLHAIFHDSAFAEFVGLWLLAHATRFDKPDADTATAADLPIERLQREATDDGVRALDHLRAGVKDAIEALGTGLLAHPRNQPLRDALAGGSLTDQEFYAQVLRTVYRWVFLFVVEDRDLLHPPDADWQAKQVYAEHYATMRLREQARTHRGGRHGDGWQHYQLLVRALRDGQPALGIPPVGGWLWSEQAAPDVDGCALDNRSLYEALRHLTTIEQDRSLHRVSYKHLGAEELGSVYESLLELLPQSDGRRFKLEVLPGNERKKTGSYYTPTSLISRVLDDALDPVIDRVIAKALEDLSPGVSAQERRARLEGTILGLTVCDPAMGSAHFLVAAAHRLARRLAQVRTDDPEPDPTETQASLRDVVSHCIYGVDVNPMAVELAKVALWLECHVPGTPLTFLDHHLKCGNSLLGATPALMQQGVPDGAFKAIEGDHKATCKAFKKRNKQLREGQRSLLFMGEPGKVHEALAQETRELDAMPDTDVEGLAAKARRHAELETSKELKRQQLIADAWCAAFTAEKHPGTNQAHPFETFYALRHDESAPEGPAVDAVRAQGQQYDFFHWHLEYPHLYAPSDGIAKHDHLGWSGGFSVMLGNPPWERVKLQEKEFFAASDPEIAGAPNAAARKRLIKQRKDDGDPIHAAYLQAKHEAEATSILLRDSGRYPLGGVGDVNTYQVFAELFRDGIAEDGRTGVIVPTGIATDHTTRHYFADLVDSRRLASLFDFENAAPIFPEVHRSYKFALLTIAGRDVPVGEAEFAFFAHDPADLDDPDRRFVLTPEDIALINPNTKTAPVFRTRRDAEITAKIYRHAPVLIREGDPDGNPWGVSFMRMFDMSNDSHLFRTRDQLEADGWTLGGTPDQRAREYIPSNVFTKADARYLPLYEDWLIHQWDHRYKSHEQGELSDTERADPSCLPLPRYWVTAEEVEARRPLGGGLPLAFRNRCRPTDSRSFISAEIPPWGAGNTVALLWSSDSLIVQALVSSFVFDFFTRQKMGGLNLNFFIVEQLPTLEPDQFRGGLGPLVLPRAEELSRTSYSLSTSAVYRWEPARRELLRAELDAVMFHLYGLDRDEVDYIMDTFPIVRRKDEAKHGEYRTKRLILQIYDDLARCLAAGRPYQTRLDPPPADCCLRMSPGQAQLSSP